MIIVKLRGGLSNQMFQYAAGRRLSHIHNTELKLDTEWYRTPQPDATPRKFELDNFNVKYSIATENDLIGLNGIKRTAFKHLHIAIFRKFFPKVIYFGERHYHFDEEILKLPNNVCLFGYWVCEKYFLDITAIIKKEFTIKNFPDAKNEVLIKKINGTNSVSLHVRRGDYISNPTHNKMYGTCSLDYYKDGIKYISEKIENPVFFIFSDDITWAKENLEIPFEKYFVENNTGEKSYEDLRLMSTCKHNIIANSGFSWWGAWLNENENKIVCAPKVWFKNSLNNTKNVIPEKWIHL